VELLFIFWIILSIIVGVNASRRYQRDGFGWFVFSIFLSPLVAFLLLKALGPKPPETEIERAAESFAHVAKSLRHPLVVVLIVVGLLLSLWTLISVVHG
jgi:NADH:ubiquinone oxidoreductase subunit 6 (subunit J)